MHKNNFTMKNNLSFIKNRIVSIIAVLCFFGMYSSESQHKEPMLFALFSVLIYGINVFVLDIATIYTRIKNENKLK